MRMKFFTIPVFDIDAAAAELDRFLASHRILKMERQFIQDGGNSSWCICVEYAEAEEQRLAVPKKGRVDYKDLLSESEFTLYSALRELRKNLAEEQKVPVYAIFNNEQMAAMVQQRTRTKTQLLQIEGVGEARVEKYGQAFLDLIASEQANSGEKKHET